jgi:BatD DUF11 like domain
MLDRPTTRFSVPGHAKRLRNKGIYSRAIKPLAWLLTAMLWCVPLLGQVEFRAVVTPESVATGGVVEVSLQLLGSTDGKLQPINSGSFRQTGTLEEVTGAQIVNGKGRLHRTWTFRVIAPQRAGEYTFPVQVLKIGQQIYRTDPISITVETVAKSGNSIQSIPKGADPDLFIATEVNHKTAFPGQQVIVEVKIFTRLNVDGYDIISVPKVSNGFLKELKRYQRSAGTTKVQGREYASQVIYAAALYPNREGKLTIEPMHINVRAEDVANPMGISLEKVSSLPVQIQVKPAPEPRPDGFTGGVGKYEFNWTAPENDTIRVGEALTLQFTMEGNGNGRFATIPPFVVPDGLQLFEPKVTAEDEIDAGGYFYHTKSVEYTVQAQRAGAFTLQPTFHWFDPDSNLYRNWQPAVPFQLTVVSDSVVVAATPKPAAPVAPKFVTPPTWWTFERIVGAISLTLAALLSLGLLGWWLWKRPKSMPVLQTTSGTPVKVTEMPRHYTVNEPQKMAVVPPKQTPPMSALTDFSLKSLSYTADITEFARILQQLIRMKLAERLGIPESRLTHRDIDSAFAKGQFNAHQHQAIQQLLLNCELVLYGGQDLSDQKAVMLDATAQLLGEI